MNVLKKNKQWCKDREQLIFFLLTFSAFLPYILSFISFAVVAAMILCNKEAWKKIVAFSGTKYLPPFALIGILASLKAKNYLGLAVFCGLVIAMLIFQYLKAVATRVIIEHTLDWFCILSIYAVFVSAIEFILLKTGIIQGGFSARCSSVFYNPNFFGTVMAFAIVVCAYKIFSKKGTNFIYYLTLILCLFGMLLSGSMFSVVEVAAGLFFLMLLSKRYKLLILFVSAGLVGIVGILFIPEILPRFSEIGQTIMIRINIWKIVLAVIKDNLLIGVGPFSYGMFSAEYASLVGVENPWPAFYAHNVLMEIISSTGILGTAFFLCYLVSIFKDFIKMHPRLKSRNLAALSTAVSIGVIVHGLVDVTILWIQPAFLFIIILSSIGALEKMKINDN